MPVKVRIPEIRIEGKPLGRHVYQDDRSRHYPAEKAATIASVLHRSYGLPLNQDYLGSCTANALVGALNTEPNNATSRIVPPTEANALTVYGRETTDEGHPYPPNDPGGSGLAVCQAAKELGWITSYTHTFNATDALLALTLRPVLFGTNWYSSFDTPDKNGIVTIANGAFVRGGHEIFANEIIANQQLIGLWNSWGDSYGLGGRFYMSWDTFEQLLAQQGDVTVPIP